MEHLKAVHLDTPKAVQKAAWKDYLSAGKSVEKKAAMKVLLSVAQMVAQMVPLLVVLLVDPSVLLTVECLEHNLVHLMAALRDCYLAA
jgi:uncharacterized protein YybS (DUF2232 family)